MSEIPDVPDFNVFVGAETGVFKGVNVNNKCTVSKNFEKIANLTKESSITCINFGETEEEILVGLRSQVVKVFDVQDKAYTATVETKAGTGKLVGVARHEDAIVTAVESGTVKWWKYNNPVEFNPVDAEVLRMGKLRKESKEPQNWTEEEKEKHAENLKIGRKLCRLRQCREERGLVGVGGKEVDLQIWDLNKPQEPVFRAKNVRADFLELRVPVWVSDLTFLTKDSVATCSRYGHIRKYDIRSSQRRPTVELVWIEKDENQTCTAICTVSQHEVLVGTATGKLALFDFRKGAGYKGLIRKYKGCVGAVSEIYRAPGSEYFGVVGLDRHLRIFKIKVQRPMYQSYLKSRLSSLLLTSSFDPSTLHTSGPKDAVKEVAEDNIEDDDIVILPGDDVQEDDFSVSVADTKLENLLSLPDATYKDKSHPFFEFFKDSRKQRKILKNTEVEAEREMAIAKIRQQFENFQKAHADSYLRPVPAKKRKLAA